MKKTRTKQEAADFFDKIERKAVRLIKSKDIKLITHLIGALGSIGRAQFYHLKLHKSEAIQDALADNRANGKYELLNKFSASKDSKLLMASYRLQSEHGAEGGYEYEKLIGAPIEAAPSEGSSLRVEVVDHETRNEVNKLTINFGSTQGDDMPETVIDEEPTE